MVLLISLVLVLLITAVAIDALLWWLVWKQFKLGHTWIIGLGVVCQCIIIVGFAKEWRDFKGSRMERSHENGASDGKKDG